MRGSSPADLVRSNAVRLVVAAIVACASGCETPAVDDAASPDASQAPDASRAPDAFVRVDAGIDAPDADAWAPPDAPTPPDAGFDCSSCRPAEPCEVFTCATSCEYAMADDGVSCGADGTCLAGECVVGGCGDGILDADEGCDDGDLDPGDGCDADCHAEILEIDVSPSSLPFSLGATTSLNPSLTTPGTSGMGASGVDDEGNLVVTWARPMASGSWELVYRRFDRFWTPVDAAPVVLGTTNFRETDCSGVVPMARGWVILWRDYASEQRARYVILPPTGATPSARDASPDETRTFSAVRLEDGFVIVWTTNRFPTGARARVFDLAGRARGDAFNLAPPGDPTDIGVFSVSRGTGTRWTALWDEGLADSRFLRREYDGASPVGAATVVVAPPLMTHVGSMVDDWLVLGGLQMVDANTVRVAAVESGVTYPDDTHWASAGESTIDETVAVASLGGGEWFAVWRQFTRFGIHTSAGTPTPRGWDRLAADTEPPESISLGRAGPRVQDGWILTYVARGSSGVRDRLRILRLVPDLTGGG
ncbi:MAG: hypothetical protein J0L92_27315 [Deltaproteobacteria bacterium]|nr:hypothetical protein [Deltaproteobacteria bacterium]